MLFCMKLKLQMSGYFQLFNKNIKQIKMRKKFTYIEFSKQIDESFRQENQLLESFNTHIFRGESEKVQRISAHIQKWKALEYFYLYPLVNSDSHNDSHFLKTILHIEFPRLRQISIPRNNLHTIEPLCRISMPFLEGISLSRNNLTSIAALRKCCWQLFCKLSITENDITDAERLSEMNLAKQGYQQKQRKCSLSLHMAHKLTQNKLQFLKNLEEFQSFQSQFNSIEKTQMEDYRWILKIKSNKVLNVKLNSKNRIQLPKILIATMRQRHFKSIQLNKH